MNLSNETYERIERYLLQEMTPEEAQTFEADCQANPELAAALAQEKKIHLLIRIHNQSRVRKQIRSLDQVAARPRVSTKIIPFARMRRVTLLIGTIAAIFLVAIGFWWNGMGELRDGPGIADRHDERYALNREAKNESSGIRGGRVPKEIEDYNNLPDSLQDNPGTRLSVAQAYYRKKDDKKADSLARMVMGNDASQAKNSLRCKAKLVVVLSSLQLNSLEEAQKLIGITKGNLDWKKPWKDGWKTGWKDLQDKEERKKHSWKAAWDCLEAEQFQALVEMNKQIENILH